MVKSVGLEGLKGYCIDIEADVRTDKEACIIIGLPDLSMKESRERILSNLYRLISGAWHSHNSLDFVFQNDVDTVLIDF
ncbi:hypothetical protein [Metalysinibacillus jejuensis]|uniref:hypothetical protein n=1 Tax=Metalysinibacillus jejuensis TaxID=914327 RepID=UPI00137AB28A|nr:hypothetical protein [Metalysinibacillus jejuensis]